MEKKKKKKGQAVKMRDYFSKLRNAQKGNLKDIYKYIYENTQSLSRIFFTGSTYDVLLIVLGNSSSLFHLPNSTLTSVYRLC